MTVKQYLNKLKKYRERQHKKTAVLLMLSLFVIAGVSWSLHLTGESTAPDLYCNNTESSHTHTLSCYSNPDADIETNDDWEKSISGVTLTGICSDDVIAVAKTQLGYSESASNYNVETDADGIEIIKGYTRYGAMYDNAYADWDAMFVSFCLKYAGVPQEDFPYEMTVSDFVEKLSDSKYKLYMEAADFTPAAGDIVFFDTDKDGIADHAGLVEELLEEENEDGVILNSIKTIEGDIQAEPDESDIDDTTAKEKKTDRVAERTYTLDDETIQGYGKMSGIKSQVETYAEEGGSSDNKSETHENADTDDNAGIVSGSDTGLKKSAPAVKKSEAAAVQENVPEAAADEPSAQAENATIEEVNFDKYTGARTYQAYFESSYDTKSPFDIYYAINVGDTVKLEIVNFEYNPQTVKDAMQGNEIVKITTSEPKPDQSAFAGMTEFQNIEFTALKQGEVTITLDGVASSTHTFGDVHKNFGGKTIKLHIRTYDIGSTHDYTNVYNDKMPAYHHVDVEIDAYFKIHVYDENGQYKSIAPENVKVQAVRATVYNTAALIDIPGYDSQKKEWDTTWFENAKPLEGVAPDLNPPDRNGKYEFQNVREVTYKGKDKKIWAYDIEYQPGQQSASTGQWEFKCQGWGWQKLYDGDTVEMDVKAEYTYDGKTYCAEQKVVVPICLANNNCPMSLGGHKIEDGNVISYHTEDHVNHGFDVKVDLNDVTEINASQMYKIDQYGNPISGAKFELKSTDGSQTINVTTDEVGAVTFRNADGTLMTLKQLKDKLGETFTMHEVEVPEGYRKMPDAKFEIIGQDDLAAGGNLYLKCTNPYDSGVWATSNARVQAPEQLNQVGSTEKINYYNIDANGEIIFNGDLYGVVMKRYKGENGADIWKPIYGNDVEGYKTTAEADEAGVRELLSNPAHPGLFKFGASESGMFVSTIVDHLPGNPEKYYTFMLNNSPGSEKDAEYAVAYYYQPKNSQDLVHISSHRQSGREGEFSIYWSSTIRVPNFENRLFFQKWDTTNHQLKDSIFAMYAVGEETNGQIYYTTEDGNKVYLKSDEDGDNQGEATIFIDGAAGGTAATYKVNVPHKNFSDYNKSSGYVTDEGVGNITVTCNGKDYIIKPTTNAEGKTLVGYTHDECNKVKGEAGTGHFEKLKGNDDNPGWYVLREILAPKGYIINPTEVKVAVLDDGVYAYAGEDWADSDNVLVGNGLGYLAANMTTLATQGVGNETLRWMFSKIGIIGGPGNNNKNSDTPPDETTYSAHPNSSTFNCLKEYRNNADGALRYINGLLAGHSNGSTRDNGKVLVNYLEYGPQSNKTLFNYQPNSDNSGRISQPIGNGTYNMHEGSETTRLYTSYGWSILEAYQDYAYGKNNRSQGTNYVNLNGKDLSHMFSDSVFVVVKDKVKADLTLLKRSDKKDDAGNNTPLDGAKFVLYKKEGNDKKYYKYEEGKVSWVNEQSQATVETASDGEFSGFMIPLPDGYTLSSGESIDIEMEYECTGASNFARIYLINGTADNAKTNILNNGSMENETTKGTIKGTLTATEKANYIYVKGKSSWEKFNTLKIKSIKLTKGDKSTTLKFNSAKIEVVGLTDTVNTGDDGSIFYGGRRGYFSFKDLDEGTYYLEEVDAPEGHEKITASITVTVGPQWSSDGKPIVQVSGGWNVAEFAGSSPYYNSESDSFQYGLTVIDESKGIDLAVNKKASVPGQEGTTPLEGAEFVLYYQSGEDKYYYPGYTVPLNDSTVWTNGNMTKTRNNDGTYTLAAGKEGEFGFAFPEEAWKSNDFRQVKIEYTNSNINSISGYVSHYGTNTVGWISSEKASWTNPAGLGQGNGTITINAEADKIVDGNYFSTVRLFGLNENSSITIKSVMLIPNKSVWQKNIEKAARFKGSSFTIEDLPDGTYYLHEEVVPDGYNKPYKDVKIVIKDNVVTSISNSGDNNITVNTEKEKYSINVVNTAGYELPATGGEGIIFYTFGGLLLMAAPLLYRCVLRRRRERRIG